MTNTITQGWDRFEFLVGIDSWDSVVEAGVGEPTKEESRAIMSLNYYGQPITKETIEGLKQKLPYQAVLSVNYDGVDGNDKKTFESTAEMKKYVEDRLGGDARNVTERSFGTDYANYGLEGATMEELGIDISRFRP